MRPRVIAITGGIGSGKSMVSRILRVMGYPVYDCDANARRLMDTSAGIKHRLATEICAEAVADDGSINRPAISQVVFNDAAKLARLNSIVHGTVTDDLKRDISNSTSPLFFFETAILQTAGLDGVADEVWHVTAPEDIGIQRVIDRNGLTATQVRARMANQNATPVHGAKIIVNDGKKPLLPQIIALLDTSVHPAR